MRALWLIAAVLAAALLVSPNGRAETGMPSGWTISGHGPAGGMVWQGLLPNQFALWDHRVSSIYLPPHYDPMQHYPVVYLLHGMAGSPSSFVDGLHLAAVADGLIGSGKVQPFIAVMPVAGPRHNPNSGEWAGTWENYVIHDVVPWTDAHLATIPTAAGRALEGLSAGGFGAMDIGLRHPGVFSTLGSWAGYFAPVFRDGPFLGASRAQLAAHNPELLVRRQAAALQQAHVRFFVSVGGNHADVRRSWSLDFAHELTRLHLQHQLWLLPASERGHFWAATVPSALAYAVAPGA